MNLQDLAVFAEAVRSGSLAAAARLGLNAMAASRRLAALETELGVRLVQRTTRALSPTAEGEAFLPHAQAMLDEQASALAALRPAGAGVSGQLRVTASAAFGRKVVAPMIARFMAANPDLGVDLLLTDDQVDIVAQESMSRCGSRNCATITSSPAALPTIPDGFALPLPISRGTQTASWPIWSITPARHWRIALGLRQERQDGAPEGRRSLHGEFHRSPAPGLYRRARHRQSRGWNVEDDLRAG
jgi:hypothetical protein